VWWIIEHVCTSGYLYHWNVNVFKCKWSKYEFLLLYFQKNDSGIILLPGITGNEESSDYIIDDFDLVLKRPPSPCNVDFVGGNVVIEGKSSLRRRAKPKKVKFSASNVLYLSKWYL